MRGRDWLVVVTIFVAIVMVARANGEAHRATAAELEARELADAALDSVVAIRAARNALVAADSARMAAMEDSAKVWRARDAQRRAEIAQERQHHASLADSVRARVDSATAVMVDRMEEAVEVAQAKTDSIISDRDAKLALSELIISGKDDLLDSLAKEVAQWERRDLARNAVEDALRDQVRHERTQKRAAIGAAAIIGVVALIR